LNTSQNDSAHDESLEQFISLKSHFSTSKERLTDVENVYKKETNTSSEEQHDSNVHNDIKSPKRKFGQYEYEFDVNGYLSVDDVVKFLRHEAAHDICVIKSSGAKRAYVDYFIVVSGVSNRHLRAMSKNLEQLVRKIT
jgi:hypothetical protein